MKQFLFAKYVHIVKITDNINTCQELALPSDCVNDKSRQVKSGELKPH